MKRISSYLKETQHVSITLEKIAVCSGNHTKQILCASNVFTDYIKAGATKLYVLLQDYIK